MKRFLNSILATMLLFLVIGCSNFSDSKADTETEMSIKVKLPDVPRYNVYYGEKEADHYVLTLSNSEKTVTVTTVEGNPGDEVKIEVHEENDYILNVKAYNSGEEPIAIAEGEIPVTITKENPEVKVKVTLIPCVKEEVIPEISLSICIDWEDEKIIELDFVGLEGDECMNCFYMDSNKLTYAKWMEVYGWAIEHGYTFNNTAKEDDNGFVVSVSWKDAIVWCNAASEKEALIPIYRSTDEEQSVIYSSESIEEFKIADALCGYRLPTDREWTYAAEKKTDKFKNIKDCISELCWSDKSDSFCACYYKTTVIDEEELVINSTDLENIDDDKSVGMRIVYPVTKN